MSHSCSTVFFRLLIRSKYLFFFLLSFNFTLWSAGTAKPTILQVLSCFLGVLFFLLLLLGLVVWPRLNDPFGCRIRRGVCVSHSPGQILGCANTFCSDGQISISCTIPNGSPCPPSHVYSCTLFVLIC